MEDDGEWKEWRHGGARRVENDIVEWEHLRKDERVFQERTIGEMESLEGKNNGVAAEMTRRRSICITER